jgi:hypothetical protein
VGIDDLNFISLGPQQTSATNFTLTSRTLTINQVNDQYLKPFVYIIVKLGPLTNPPSTRPTGTFEVTISDQSGGVIETINQGINFKAISGAITQFEVHADNMMINESNVTYSFSFLP